jgi:hypothetical protein
MAMRNYRQAKRNREETRKKRQQQKLERKQHRDPALPAATDAPAPVTDVATEETP